MIQRLPDVGERVNSGPVQFGDDWPGVFVRGDEVGPLLAGLDALDRERGVTHWTRRMRDLISACRVETV